MRPILLTGMVLLILALTACTSRGGQSMDGNIGGAILDSLSSAALYVTVGGFALFVIGLLIHVELITGVGFLVGLLALVVWIITKVAWRGFG